MAKTRYTNIIKTIKRFCQIIVKFRRLLIRKSYRLSQNLLANSYRERKAGFVIPTVVLLLLVLSLIIGALVSRSLTRATQVIGERQQQVIYNAASPAIDRARAKLEYLFNGDSRLPSGIPPENTLTSMMLNDKSNGISAISSDPYTLPDETRLDINGDKVADNAWSYQINAKGKVDANGKPILDTTIAYSIVWATPNSNNNPPDPPLNDTSTNTITTRASLLQVRTGPLSNSLLSQACLTGGQQSALLTGQGWFDSNAFLTKNFQIDAFVLPSDQTNGTISTLELEQDRQVNKGNTWGGWFRYDLEAYPGARFNWNGALHTEGNLILTTEGNTFTGYLISSPASCLYTQPASQITVGQPIASNNGGVAFQGQIVNGSMKRNALYGNNLITLGPGINTGPSTFHLFNGQGTQPITTGDPNNPPNVILQSGNQTSTDSIQNTVYPADVALDPVALITKNISQARPILTSGKQNPDQTNVDKQDSNWDNGSFNKYKRIFRQSSAVPYVDDTYRADNRYGPKPTYGQTAQLKLPANTAIGQTILNNDPNYQTLTSNTLTVPNDPASFGLDGYWERRASNEGLRIIVGQRLELGNAFGWGSNSDPLYPPLTNTAITNEARQRRSQRDNLAAVQSTAIYHYTQNNGSFPTACLATTVHPGTAQTITNSTSAGTLNFFIGQSTNGVEEYAPPIGNESDFAKAIDNSNSPLRKALNNLAYFAGDPNGGAPSYTPVQDLNIHPYPYLAMWGDFSNLRRIIPILLSAFNTGTSYTQLSIADKSYLHTAACTLGILATNITNIQAKAINPKLADLNNLATTLSTMNLVNNPTPDAYIQQLIINKDPNTQLAQQLMLNEQINRDRTYGFSNTLACKLSVGLSRLCPTQPKYPSLFYLFPVAVHDYQGKDSKNQIIQNQTTIGETYISDSYNQFNAQIDPTIPPDPKNPLKNLHYQYQIINDINPTDISSITLTTQRNLPTGAFTEKAFFNGREMLNVRTMDIDLDQLRRNFPPNSNDTWLSTTGTVYAFREDAVREDSIVRPAGSNIPNQGSMCLYTAQCPTQVLPPPPTDPKIGDNGITIKTVDYYADPERRPHGFRLINGTDLKRIGIADSNNIHGLSFISDAFVYIKGDLNYHSTDGTANNLIEEFKETLNQSNWSNFYTRKTLNSNFAQPITDHWRPVEILADGVSIISNNFLDGSIEDGIIGSQTSSYSNQNPIKSNSRNWIRENPYDSKSPIVISQNGNPLYCSNALPPPCISPQDISNQYNNFTTGRTLMNATQTRVNATIIGGIVPSQAGQAYGGLHNFPRFLESWSNQNLYISGSFLQLNFSTTATAPFDQDAWEPPNSANPNVENIPYYGAPNRLWGYDVGLQYAPAGPVSQRFVTPNNTRSEFYQELLANDPYICNLRRAKFITGNSSVPGNQVDPSANAANCPNGSSN